MEGLAALVLVPLPHPDGLVGVGVLAVPVVGGEDRRWWADVIAQGHAEEGGYDAVRRELRGAEGDLVRMLERMMAGLDAHQQVPDMSVSVRNGRYVIPIRREARTAIHVIYSRYLR